MNHGKSAAQAGHAFLGSALQCLSEQPERIRPYLADPPGTKVVLTAHLGRLLQLQDELLRAKVPYFVVYDSGCPEFFAGQPVLTAVGFGPATAAELPAMVRKLQTL